MADTTIRWALAKHFITKLRALPALEDVQIEPGFPGDTQEPDSIWISELDGDLEIPVSKAARMQRDDKFTIPFEFRVAGRVDLDETMTRLSVLVAALEELLATDPGLENFDGLIDAEINSEVMTAGNMRGAGCLGFAQVVVSAHARLT